MWLKQRATKGSELSCCLPSSASWWTVPSSGTCHRSEYRASITQLTCQPHTRCASASGSLRTPADQHLQPSWYLQDATCSKTIRVVQPMVFEGHKTMLAAIVKKFSQDNRPKPWATIKHVEAVGRVQAHWAWARLYFLIHGSVVYMWRVGDEAAITWNDIKRPGWMFFYDHKVNEVRVAYGLFDYIESWRRYI